MTGRPCRGALTTLTERQYFEKKKGWVLSPQLHEALYFLSRTLQIMPYRKVNLATEYAIQLVLYSDTSTTGDGSGLMIGILLLEKGKTALCTVHDVPKWVIRKWVSALHTLDKGSCLLDLWHWP